MHPLEAREVPLTLRGSMRAGLLFAAVCAAVVLFGLGVFAALDWLGVIPVQPGAWRGVGPGLPVVVASYLLAGTLGGASFWLLRSRRPSLGGWVLTGMLVAGGTYGSVGLCITLAYVLFGMNLSDYSSAAEAWNSLAAVTSITAVLVGVPGGLWYWWKERD